MKNKKLKIKFIKGQTSKQKLLNNIDYDSLKLFREMMSDRFKNK